MIRIKDDGTVVEREEYKAILVGVSLGEDISYSLEELEGLAEAAGIETLGVMTQNAEKINAATYIGKGKLDELAELVHNMEADLVVFNAIIGNADAHGKNYSMLYDGKSRRLAPGYDLVSTVFWPALASAPAMKIGGSDSINSILSGHWRKFAQETGVSLAALRSRIKHLCTAVASQTCASLAIPQECECVLAIVRERAESLKTYLK